MSASGTCTVPRSSIAALARVKSRLGLATMRSSLVLDSSTFSPWIFSCSGCASPNQDRPPSTYSVPLPELACAVILADPSGWATKLPLPWSKVRPSAGNSPLKLLSCASPPSDGWPRVPRRLTWPSIRPVGRTTSGENSSSQYRRDMLR
ncbi:hypothetical protein D3C73_1168680 [compost metagenome]